MSIDLMYFTTELCKEIEQGGSYHTLTNSEKVDDLLAQFEEVETAAEKKNTERMKRELIKLAAKSYIAWRSIK